MNMLPTGGSTTFGPIPRRDILAVCAYLNRSTRRRPVAPASADPDALLDRLAAAARMQ